MIQLALIPALLLNTLPAAQPCEAQLSVRLEDAAVGERTAYLMGTLLRVRLSAPTAARAHAAADAVFEEVARLEQVLSSWTAGSEIGQLNQAPLGSAVALSPELHVLLKEAAAWVERTNGAFDPAVGALIDAWALRAGGRLPTAAERAAALAATGLARADFDTTGGRLTRPTAGWWLDTGGFGKGAALRAAVTVLRDHGVVTATLDFGGQLVQMGVPPTSAMVAVADPAERAHAVAWVRVCDGSIATSGASERFVEVNGARLGHILDPRNGRPVPAWGSVTVIADDAVAADVLSTALFVMGPDEALAWAKQTEAVGVLVLRTAEGGGVTAEWNDAMEEWLDDVSARAGVQAADPNRQ